jgi:hypothetical protein
MSDDKCSIIEGCMQLRATYDVAPSSTAAMADDGIGGMATMAVAAPHVAPRKARRVSHVRRRKERLGMSIMDFQVGT